MWLRVLFGVSVWGFLAFATGNIYSIHLNVGKELNEAVFMIAWQSNQFNIEFS